MSDSKIYIYGKNAVAEALKNRGGAVEKVFTAPFFNDAAILNLIKKAGAPVGSFNPGNLPKPVPAGAVHQGILASVNLSKLVLPYREFIENLPVTSDTALALLGELDDPQNVGAVIRSAAAFGLAGVLIPERREAPITGSVVKVSAGMAFRIPLVRVGNVNSTLRDLKTRGFLVYGLDGEAKRSISREQFSAPAVFIVGNESEGIREKTRELCDKLVSIPINPKCESLNAAASAAVGFFAWSAKHQSALRT